MFVFLFIFPQQNSNIIPFATPCILLLIYSLRGNNGMKIGRREKKNTKDLSRNGGQFCILCYILTNSTYTYSTTTNISPHVVDSIIFRISIHDYPTKTFESNCIFCLFYNILKLSPIILIQRGKIYKQTLRYMQLVLSISIIFPFILLTRILKNN